MSSEAAQDGVLSGSKPGHATTLPPATPPPDIPDHETLRCIGRGSYGEVCHAYYHLGEFEKALESIRKRRSLKDEPYFMTLEACVRAKMGQRESAVKILAGLETISHHRYVDRYPLV